VKGLVRVLASGLGTGFSPLAPGTAGSLLAALLYWLIAIRSWWLYLSVLVVGMFLGVYVSGQAELLWGHDAGRIVIDEVVGMWVTMAFLPRSFLLLASGFFLFRGLDIWKPFPIRRSQRFPGGWGVMTDDLIAGVYANLLLQLGWFLYQTLSV
jgi:phosphatidylglycerophosphatase A